MGLAPSLAAALEPLLAFALPPRCPACGEITASQGSFCTPCWQDLAFIDGPICSVCGTGLPGHSADDLHCGACLSDPPPYDSARAATHFGGAARELAHRFKYGRRVSHAKIMARFMARHVVQPVAQGLVIIPVPLHRWRLWSRGFNQAALLAQELARLLGCQADVHGLERAIHTPPLHNLGPKARRKLLASAFRMRAGAQARLAGRPVLLIDDILTTGATAASCTKLLRNAGAARVDLLCWTRVSPQGEQTGHSLGKD
jgi:ComF family protein